MIVVDTSVVFKWFDASEARAEQALGILEKHLVGQREISVPDLMVYEVANAWVTKSALLPRQVLKNLKMLNKYRLNYQTIDFSLLEAACKMAKEYQVTVYDAVFAVLAKNKGCKLVTADKRFVKRTGFNFVKLI